MRLSTAISWAVGGFILAGMGLLLSDMAVVGALFVPRVLIGISFMAAGFSITALPCAFTLERGKLRGAMWLGIGASAFSAAGWGVIIWIVESTWWTPERVWVVTFGTSTVAAVWCMVFALVMMYRINLLIGRVMRWFTVTTTSLAAMIVLSMIWGQVGDSRFDGAFSPLAILIVFSAVGLLATIMIARLRQLTSGEEQFEEIVRMDITVWCPRCEREQTIQTGGAQCAQCGLGIRITIP